MCVCVWLVGVDAFSCYDLKLKLSCGHQKYMNHKVSPVDTGMNITKPLPSTRQQFNKENNDLCI